MRTLARAGLVLFTALTAPRAAAADPDPAAAAALIEFVNTDCEVGQPGQALARLLEHAPAAQPELIRILNEGPDEVTSIQLRAEAEAAFDRRAAFLSTNPPLGLSPEDLLRVHSVDRETWIETQLAHISQRMRARAASALAAIRSPTAVRALRQARGGAGHDLQAAIDEALARIPASGTRTPRRKSRPAVEVQQSARP